MARHDTLDLPGGAYLDGKPTEPKGTSMLARQKWQVNTIRVLEMVFEERLRQWEKHGGAMRELPDGTGPDVPWARPLTDSLINGDGSPLRISRPHRATEIQELFRDDYVKHRGAENPDGKYGQLTRMHIVREELAEMFELEGDDPNFIGEALQVAALVVQWVEYKLEKESLQNG